MTLVLAGRAALAARAQLGPSSTSSTTTETSSTLVPTVTTDEPGDESSTTTEPVDGESSSTTSTTEPPLPAGDGPVPVGVATTLPPGAQAFINSIKRSPSNSSAALIAALQPLVTDVGLSPAEALHVGFGQFPIEGLAKFSHDFLFPRFVPTFHFHQGTDIFAEFGTPVRAPDTGTVRITNGPIGGLAVYVTLPDKTYYYMSHLQSVVPELADGQIVERGTIVGFVGDSGNARGGSPHVHFEIHPRGGAAIDPKTTLDQWLLDAVKAAPNLVNEKRKTQSRALVATALLRPLEERVADAADAPAAPSRPQLLWVSSANPAGGSVQVAQAEAANAADHVDWTARADEARAEEQAYQRAEAMADAVIDPLTPAAFR